MSAAQMQLLTAKLAPKDLSALKKSILSPGFVDEWNSLDSLAGGFAKVLLAKQNTKPSATYKLFMSYDPEAILWLGFTSKNKEIQERFNLFLKVWPDARQRIPYVLMHEMRINPELPAFADIVSGIFLELIDGKLITPEEMRAYLEPHSPPAPPPQVTVKRTRARRSAEARVKEQALEDEDEEDSDESLAADDDLEPIGADEELDLSVLPKGALSAELGDEEESGDEEDLEDEEEVATVGGKKAASVTKKGQKQALIKGGKTSAAAKTAVSRPTSDAKLAPVAKSESGKAAGVSTPANVASVKSGPAPAAKTKPATPPVAAKTVKPAPKPPAKPLPKPPVKAAVKPPAGKIAKQAPVKKSQAHAKAEPTKHPPAKSSKPVAKKPAFKPAKKR